MPSRPLPGAPLAAPREQRAALPSPARQPVALTEEPGRGEMRVCGEKGEKGEKGACPARTDSMGSERPARPTVRRLQPATTCAHRPTPGPREMHKPLEA